MDIHKIEMPKAEVTKKIEAFKKRLLKMKHSKANEEVRREYEAALKGYEQMAKGTPLIDLDEVFQACPCDEKGRPRMAIARADRKQVRMLWERGNKIAMCFDTHLSWNPPDSMQISIDMGRNHEKWITYKDGSRSLAQLDGYAIVPMVPLDVRPTVGQLKDWFVLWEVEAWADNRIQSKPDIDPYLLKHIGGSLYAVIAEWDLTDLERSIMKGRIGN